MAQGLAKVSELENADSRTSRLPHCEAPAQGNLQILGSRKERHGHRPVRMATDFCGYPPEP